MTFKDYTKVLLDSKSKINSMSQAFAHQFGFKTQKSNIKTLKIDGIILETYGMVISTFSMSNKDVRKRFFKKSFAMANVTPDIVLKMPFLIINNVDVDFQTQDL